MLPIEAELKNLMTAGLDGDAMAHRLLLERLSRLLRGYYKRRLARIGRGATEAEDLCRHRRRLVSNAARARDVRRRSVPA